MPSTHYKNTDNLKCNDHFSKFPFATLMKLTEHSLWNAPMEHRKFRAFPKLIFKTLKVLVVSLALRETAAKSKAPKALE